MRKRKPKLYSYGKGAEGNTEITEIQAHGINISENNFFRITSTIYAISFWPLFAFNGWEFRAWTLESESSSSNQDCLPQGQWDFRKGI